MKKCPTCQETFGDEKKFCQKDGTPLVDVVEPPPLDDPFKTVIGAPPPTTSPNISGDAMKTFVVSSENKEEDILQIPEAFDPMKTVVVSEPMKFNEPSSTPPPSEPVVPAPEPPKFNEPSLSPPVFNDVPVNEPPVETPSPFSPPPIEPPKMDEPAIPNPFSAPPTMVETPKVESTPPPTDSPFDQPFSPSTPSPFSPPPFNEPVATPPVFNEPVATPPPFNEPQPVAEDPKPFGSSPFDPPAPTFGQPANDPFNQPTNDPFNNQPIQGDAGWNPLAPPAPSWDNAPVANDMSGIPPAPVGVGTGQSKTLAIASLVCGLVALVMIVGGFIPLLGLGCFGLSIILALAAIITGILARMRSSKNPDQYGGGGLALGGIISGVLTLLVWIGLVVVAIVFLGMGGAFSR